MKRFFSFIFQLIAAAVLVFILTSVWVVLDGLNDAGESADAGLLYVDQATPTDAGLDHVAKLFKDHTVPLIILSSFSEAENKAVAARKYLEEHGVSSSAIVDNMGNSDIWQMAGKADALLQSHDAHSVMIIANYTRMTRIKLALSHAGLSSIEKNHLGSAGVGDIVEVGSEVVAIYEYIGKTFLLPAAEKLKQEAKAGADKAKADAAKAKESIDKKLDSLPKDGKDH